MESKRLADVADLHGGFAFKSKDYRSHGRFVLRTLNIRDDGRITREGATFISDEQAEEYSRFELQPNDTLFVMVGATLGKVGFVTEDVLPALLNQNMWVIRTTDKDETHPRFLNYWFKWKVKETLQWASGSAREFVRRDDYRNLEFPQIDHDRQCEIAAILGCLDDKIELNRRMNETLEAMARAIFKSWFVDFDPVRAKAEGRQPQGIPAHIANLFPDSFQDSPFGPIPQGWSIEKLEAIADINPKLSLKRGELATYVDMKALPSRGSRPDGYWAREFTSGTKFQNGDTLLARITPCLENGKTGFVDFLDEGETAWGSTEFIVIRPHKPIPAVWGYLLARDTQFRNHAITNMTGSSGRQRVPPDVVSNYEVVRATKEVYEAFAELVEPMFKLIGTQADESLTLANTRDALLPKLLSGEFGLE